MLYSALEQHLAGQIAETPQADGHILLWRYLSGTITLWSNSTRCTLPLSSFDWLFFFSYLNILSFYCFILKGAVIKELLPGKK